MAGILNIVSIDIGNPKDITLRAIDAINECDVLICEELKEGRRLLHRLNIQKECLTLNEHTRKEATDEALDLLREGKTLALVSDAGTPLLADPGSDLVQWAIAEGAKIHALPGASSVLAALVMSGFPTESFTFVGFLGREKSERKRQAASYATRKETLILLEAPYRLSQVLDDLVLGFGPKREAAICMDLTTSKERVHRGPLLQLKEYFAQHPFKGEFVVVIRGAEGGHTSARRHR